MPITPRGRCRAFPRLLPALIACAAGLAFADASAAAGFVSARDSAHAAAAEALRQAHAAAGQDRWDSVEAGAREALLRLPTFEPDSVLVEEACGLFTRSRERRGASALQALASLDTVVRDLYDGSRLHLPRRMLERSIALRAEQVDTLDVIGARAHHLLGHVTFDMAEFDLARRHYQIATEVYRRLEGEESVRVTSMLFNMSNLDYMLGDHGAALQKLEVCRERYERMGADGLPLLADVYINLSAVLGGLQDPYAARHAAERCIAIRRSLGMSGRAIADPMANLAGSYNATGEPGRAVAISDSAIAMYRATALGDAEPWIDEAVSVRTEGLVALGRYDEAEPDLRRLLRQRIETQGSANPEVAQIQLWLADVHGARGDYLRALALAESSLAVYRQLYPPEHLRFAEVDEKLAGLRLAAGDSAAAFASALAAEERARRHLVEVAPGIPQATLVRSDGLRSTALHRAIASLPAAAPEADRMRLVDAVVRTRGLVLEIQTQRLLAGAGDPRFAAARLAFERACARLSSLVLSPPTAGGREAYAAALSAARVERDRREAELAGVSGAVRGGEGASAAGLAEVMAALPPGAALLGYVRHGGWRDAPGSAETAGYAAFVARAGSDTRLVRLGGADAIERAVKAWRHEAGRPSSDPQAEAACRRAGRDLRLLVWDPLEVALAGAAEVFLVPDGALHLVNFAALPAARDRYLLDTGPAFTNLAVERDIVPTGEGDGAVTTVPGGLLAVGGVDFDHASPGAGEPVALAGGAATFRSAHSSCSDFARLRVAPLPASSTEAQQVVALWRRASDRAPRLLTGARASEAEFKRQAAGHELIHLATHGFFLGPECLSSGAAGEEPPLGVIALSAENALLRSGLALAGFNARDGAAPAEEDGVLTAAEVAALDLRAARCVVLSACETGVGDVESGEGVFGLRRAFRLAGAQALVSTLWRVEDHAASAWTGRFHDAYLGGASPTAAAQAASKSLLDRRRRRGESTHPSEWGAYLAVGGAATRR